MSKIINGIEYFTIEEMKKRTSEYIKKTSKEMIIEIKRRRQENGFLVEVNEEKVCTA